MGRKIIVGSRESRLAVVQSRIVMDEIHKYHPELELELVTMKTTGDKILDRTLDKVGGKGLFVKELDQALLEGRVDITVHSLKDMPMELSPELPLAAFSRRADPRDALILPTGETSLLLEKPIGCSSARRILQLGSLLPGTSTKSVRGNVITRLAKLDAGEFSALVLARAGLLRLELESRISRVFSVEEMIPAAGQGVLAVQTRADGDMSFLDCVDDRDSRIAATAERAFVRALGGGCSSPIAAYAVIAGDEIKLSGLYCGEDGKYRTGVIAGDAARARQLGEALAAELGEKE